MTTVAVIDFETTGLSPLLGDRATEIAIVILERDQVVDRYQSLMNAGVRISSFIEAFTGISNEMIAAAPLASQVMAEAARFVAGRPMAAHNASFDRRFWAAELQRIDQPAPQLFACTLLLSRRLYPQAPNYRLGSLAAFHCISLSGRAHRALADAEVAAALLGQIRSDLRIQYKVVDPRHELLMKLQACTRKALPKAIEKHLVQAGSPPHAPVVNRLATAFQDAPLSDSPGLGPSPEW